MSLERGREGEAFGAGSLRRRGSGPNPAAHRGCASPVPPNAADAPPGAGEATPEGGPGSRLCAGAPASGECENPARGSESCGLRTSFQLYVLFEHCASRAFLGI